MKAKSVELHNELTVPYVEQGDPLGAPVILLHGLAGSRRSFWRETNRGLLEDDSLNHLEGTAAPTLIVWGDEDTVSSRSDQEALAAAIPKSRLLVYGGSGHTFHFEQPERVAADLAAFVEDDAR